MKVRLIHHYLLLLNHTLPPSAPACESPSFFGSSLDADQLTCSTTQQAIRRSLKGEHKSGHNSISIAQKKYTVGYKSAIALPPKKVS